MAEALTFLADEIGRAAALVWGGVGIAVRLNYEIMNNFVFITSRIIQVLLLLTQKTAQLFSILGQDALLFLGDIGNGVFAAGSMILTFATSIKNGLVAIGTGISTMNHQINSVIWWFHTAIITIIHNAINQVINLAHLIKSCLILFGSSVIFAVSFLPNLVCLLLTSSAQLIANVYLRTGLLVHDCFLLLKYGFEKASLSLSQFFSDIPVHAVFGTFLGVVLIICVRRLFQYMIDNVILIPDIPFPSVVTTVRRRLLNWYVRIWQEANRPLVRENSTDEEVIDDTNDENGNDNNDNVPDRNLTREQPSLPQPLPLPLPPFSHMSRGHGVDELSCLPSNSSTDQPVQRDESLDDRGLIIMPVKRPPITRKRRALGFDKDVTEDQVVQVTGGVVFDKEDETPGSSNVNKNKDLRWAKQLYKELQDEREGKLCIICQDKPKSVILLPCKHMCLCDSCRSAVIIRDNSCPVCRRPILDSLRVYWS